MAASNKFNKRGLKHTWPGGFTHTHGDTCRGGGHATNKTLEALYKQVGFDQGTLNNLQKQCITLYTKIPLKSAQLSPCHADTAHIFILLYFIFAVISIFHVNIADFK